ncbi:hypothetical protein CYY_003366 [Polysphondylium violaceum]|uniref:SGF29 C-terminal domain-containing protein n=1 Tax=Polysphondylium violaceum TaxID=133409 RepID=A0A8J4PWZ6_9MYCE|nr:hypothetical protein CYY_003366 [Polysphondylium violaceum]
MTDAQLLSSFGKLEKILKETEVYTKLINLNKEGVHHANLYDDDELLFPLDVGNDMYAKTLKVYLESKAFVESIEKSLNKCIDKIGKNEKAAPAVSKFNNNNNNNSNNNNNNSSNSSSSSDEESKVEIGQKRKSKKPATPNSKFNKRAKQPPPTDDSSKDTDVNSNDDHSSPTITTPTKEKESSSGGSKEPKEKEKDHNSTTISSGQQVAAKDSKSSQWILAKVNGFNQKTQKYEVIDEDEDEPKRFSVAPKDVIQLPTLSTLPPTFANNTKVLAMFPDTTAFYPAVVVSVTKTKGKPTHYTLHFEDDQENGQTPNRRVSALHVISFTK